ncbi:MAG TPA: HD domain-containing phosphohydrolase, partial [Armatimonadota bacterium]|nr:HD domain-containing phosphohydrolase [Armatimonadota bacterium]
MKLSNLPVLLKGYILLVAMAGSVAGAATLALPLPQQPGLVAVLVAATVLFSTWKVRLTIGQSEMTLTSAVVCLAMLLEGPSASALCAGVGGFIGSVTGRMPGKWIPILKSAEFHRVLFNVCNCVFSAVVGAFCYYWLVGWPAAGHEVSFGALAVGALVFQSLQFILNTFGLSVVLSILKSQGVLKVWRENFLWTGPSYFASGSVAVAIHTAYYYPLVGPLALLLLGPLYFIYISYRVYMDRMNLYVAKVEQDRRHIDELNDLNAAIIASLATAIDAKDRYTRSHINRVQMYAEGLGEAVGLTFHELEAVRTGALIHDIGKLGIPERILGKPGKLTPDEFRRMQAHVAIGVEILAPVKFPYPVLPIVETHHERWDGLGYPRGLRGEEIPLGGRIMAVADVFDALTSNRPYRCALSVNDALSVIREGAGKQFDPNLVEQFTRILPAVRARVQEMEARAEGPAPGAVGAAPDAEPNWAFSQISQAAAEMSATCELAHGLAETSTVDEVVGVVADRSLRLLPADTAIVYLCDADTGDLRAAKVAGLYAEKLADLRISRGEGVSGWVAETLQPQINAQASLDVARRFNPSEQMELSAAAAVPLVQGSTTVGVLSLY